MRKQTVGLLIVLLGSFSALLAVTGGRVLPFPKLLAQVGITVGIAPNPYNTLASQLNQEQSQLDQQAADLAARQAALASSTAENGSPSAIDWYLAVAITIVAILLLLNFYFDWRRARRESEATPAVPSDTTDIKE